MKNLLNAFFLLVSLNGYCQFEQLNIAELYQKTKELRLKALEKTGFKNANPNFEKHIRVFSLILYAENESLLNLNKTANLGVIIFDNRVQKVHYLLKSDTILHSLTSYEYEKEFIFNYVDTGVCYVMSNIKTRSFLKTNKYFHFLIQNNDFRNSFIGMNKTKYNNFDSLICAYFGTIAKFKEVENFNSFRFKLLSEYSSNTLEGACKIIANSWPLKCLYFPDKKDKIINAYLGMITGVLNLNNHQQELLKSEIIGNFEGIKNTAIEKYFKNNFNAYKPRSTSQEHLYKFYDFHYFVKQVLTDFELKCFDFYYEIFNPDSRSADSLYGGAYFQISRHYNNDKEKVENVIKEIVKNSMKQF